MQSSRFNKLWVLDPLRSYFCLLFLIGGTSFGAEIEVPEAFESIQMAIDSAESGDVISIAGGVYYERIDLKGKPIVLKSRSSSKPAILDGGGKPGSLLKCVSGETDNTQLNGLTFRQGLGDKELYGGTALVGGAVLICDSSPTLNRCRFELNQVTYNGGAIYARNSNSQLVGCEFNNNAAEKGAAIYVISSRLSILQSLFEQNNARFGGGAIYSDNRSFVTIDKCQFIENRASFNGGALYDYNSTTFVENSIFLNNIGAFKGGAAYYGWRSRSRMGSGNDFRTPNDDIDGSGWTISDSNPLGACFIGESCIMSKQEVCKEGGGVWGGPETTCGQDKAQERPESRARGDLNRDGIVNVRDMAILMSTWGTRGRGLR